MTPEQRDVLRTSWQCRVLDAARFQLGAIVLSMLAHSWPDHVTFMCQAVFGDDYKVIPPFLKSCGKITRGGRIVADLIDKDEQLMLYAHMFRSEAEMEAEFRNLADQLKLDDAERIQLFVMARKWLVADFRINPLTMEKVY